MNPMRIVTVDDEGLALRRLRHALTTLDDVVLVGEAGGCVEAADKIARLQPDIVLLDIHMRDGSGFDLIDSLPTEHLPAIIFVSAFDHHAIRAFEANAADYVLKPVDTDRLAAAIGRARLKRDADKAGERMAELQAIIAGLREELRDRESGTRYETELWIRKSLGGYVRVSIENIEWVSSEDDYVRIHTAAGSYLLRGSIRAFEQRVAPGIFTRIHRRTLVRAAAIREVTPSRISGMEVVLANGKRLKTGRIHAKAIRALLNG
jgi:DNA-binding LytR/AlgR family response regulator